MKRVHQSGKKDESVDQQPDLKRGIPSTDQELSETAEVFYQLGIDHECGKEKAQKDYVMAVKYYQYAKEKGCKKAQEALERLFNCTDMTDDVLNNIGCLYYDACRLFAADYTQAKQWYEKAAQKGCATAFHNLGVLYAEGKGVVKDYATAARYYQQATEKGYEKSQQALGRLLDIADITGQTLNIIGVMYDQGSQGVKVNYEQARRWYEKAVQRGSAIALRNLGLLYEEGKGVPKSYVTTAKYYQQAKEQGYTEAQKDLDRLFNNSNIPAADLVNIGSLYYQGKDGIKVDYEQAKRWYEKAAQQGSAQAWYCLATLYENGSGVAKDYVKAAEYYNKSAELGYDQEKLIQDYERLLSKPDLNDGIRKRLKIKEKEFEKLLITQHLTDKNYLSHALVRSARHGQLKNYARFFLALGDDSQRESPGPLLPGIALKDDQLEKMHYLRDQLIEILQPAITIIISHMLPKLGFFDPSDLHRVLSEFYSIDAIRPLLDVAKLAVLGLHDLSKRTKFTPEGTVDGYDSDEDADEPMTRKQCLSIFFDPRRTCVEGLYSWDKSRGAVGVYPVGMLPNTCYVAGCGEAMRVRGTLLHELTHFVINEVYKNGCIPYRKTTEDDARCIEVILQDLQKDLNQLPTLVKEVFESMFKNYDQTKWPDELLVRVAQIIGQSPRGIKELEQGVTKNLFDYYKNVFLEDVKRHAERLERRALSGWPKKLFMQDGMCQQRIAQQRAACTIL